MDSPFGFVELFSLYNLLVQFIVYRTRNSPITSTYRGYFLIFGRGVHLIYNSKDLKWNIRVLIRKNGTGVQLKRNILTLEFYCIVFIVVLFRTQKITIVALLMGLFFFSLSISLCILVISSICVQICYIGGTGSKITNQRYVIFRRSHCTLLRYCTRGFNLSQNNTFLRKSENG